MPAKYYISYRSGDAQVSAARLRTLLTERFGAGSVFDARVDITPGSDFRHASEEAINACEVVVLVIGPNWLAETRDSDQPTDGGPEDYVRAEIEAALAADKYIVPALVDGARMPTDAELPESIRKLAGWIAVEFGTADVSFRKFMRVIEFVSQQNSGQRQRAFDRPLAREANVPGSHLPSGTQRRLPAFEDEWEPQPDRLDDPFGRAPSSPPAPSAPPSACLRPSGGPGGGPMKSGLPMPSSPQSSPSSQDKWDHVFGTFPPETAEPPPPPRPMDSGPSLANIFGAIGRAIGGAVGAITGRSDPTQANHPSTPFENTGSPSPAEPTVMHADPVSLAVTAPAASTPGARFTAILAAYVESALASVEAKLQRMGGPAASPLMGIAPDRQSCWVVGAPVTVRVTAEGADVEPADRVFEWNGRENLAPFSVFVRPNVTAASIDVCFHVALGGVPIACIPLPVSLTAERASGATKITKRIRTAESAFASYSSKDTVTVAYCLSTLSRWSPGLSIFQDCLDLKPNEAFKPQLTKRIADSDVFLLFWSRSAAASPWCQWELDTARTAKGFGAVIPMPLEDPKIAPPPPEFAEVHMRDRFMVTRYAMQRVNEEVARLRSD